MTCRDLIEALIDYLEGDLTDAERLPVERHLARCADCAGYLASYRATIVLARAAYGVGKRWDRDGSR